MHYALWDLGDGNLITETATEEEALAVVREIVEGGDQDQIGALGLSRYDEAHVYGVAVASGEELVQRAVTLTSA